MKVGSLSFVLVVGDVWAAGLLRFATVFLAGLVWCFDSGKDWQRSLGRFSGGIFCSGLFGWLWSADGDSLDLVLAAMSSCYWQGFAAALEFADAGHGPKTWVLIRWVWDPGIPSTMCSGLCYCGVARLLVCLRRCGRLGGLLTACNLVSDQLKDREEEDGLGLLGLGALLLAFWVRVHGSGFGFGPLVPGLLLCFVYFGPVVG